MMPWQSLVNRTQAVPIAAAFMIFCIPFALSDRLAVRLKEFRNSFVILVPMAFALGLGLIMELKNTEAWKDSLYVIDSLRTGDKLCTVTSLNDYHFYSFHPVTLAKTSALLNIIRHRTLMPILLARPHEYRTTRFDHYKHDFCCTIANGQLPQWYGDVYFEITSKGLVGLSQAQDKLKKSGRCDASAHP